MLHTQTPALHLVVTYTTVTIYKCPYMVSRDGHIRALFHLATHLLHCWSRVHTTPAIEGFPPSSEKGRGWSVGEKELKLVNGGIQ